jgi:hypothetical protein
MLQSGGSRGEHGRVEPRAAALQARPSPPTIDPPVPRSIRQAVRRRVALLALAVVSAGMSANATGIGTDKGRDRRQRDVVFSDPAGSVGTDVVERTLRLGLYFRCALLLFRLENRCLWVVDCGRQLSRMVDGRALRLRGVCRLTACWPRLHSLRERPRRNSWRKLCRVRGLARSLG